MNAQNHHWQQVLTAFKASQLREAQQLNTEDQAADLIAPRALVTRLAARASGARREKVLSTWRRWSLCAAAGSGCMFVVALFYAAMTKDTGSLMPIPALELPN